MNYGWKVVEPHTLGRLSRERDNRLFVNTTVCCVHTGISWCGLPERRLFYGQQALLFAWLLLELVWLLSTNW